MDTITSICPTCGRGMPFQCNRCGNQWDSKIKEGPKNCPKCKSPYWNKPRVRAGKLHPRIPAAPVKPALCAQCGQENDPECAETHVVRFGHDFEPRDHPDAPDCICGHAYDQHQTPPICPMPGDIISTHCCHWGGNPPDRKPDCDCKEYRPKPVVR
jgi:DNA-directed RNA polymerase subunit RPC12/RpoP